MKSKFTLGAQVLRKGPDVIEEVKGVQEINGAVYLRCGDLDGRWLPESQFELVKGRR
jgi:hypothetical protein